MKFSRSLPRVRAHEFIAQDSIKLGAFILGVLEKHTSLHFYVNRIFALHCE